MMHAIQQREMRDGQQRQAAAAIALIPFDVSCHTGFPSDHPTAGRHHVGGLSSAMIDPGLRKMVRECVRDNGFGRKCRGDIVSYTEGGFLLATCSVCCLPAEESRRDDDGGDGNSSGDEDGGEDGKQAAKRGNGDSTDTSAKKKQRI